MERPEARHNSDLRIVQTDSKKNARKLNKKHPQKSGPKLQQPSFGANILLQQEENMYSQHHNNNQPGDSNGTPDDGLGRMTNMASSGTYQLRQSIVTIGVKEEEHNASNTLYKKNLIKKKTTSTILPNTGAIILPLHGSTAIVHHHKRSENFYIGKKQQTNAQTSTNHIDPEDDEHQNNQSPKHRATNMSSQTGDEKPASVYKICEFIRDHTGISAARKKHLQQLKGQNKNDQRVLRPKQFQMLMPEQPLKSEELIFEARIHKKSGIPEASNFGRRVIPDTLINLEDSGDFIADDQSLLAFTVCMEDHQILQPLHFKVNPKQTDGGTQTEQYPHEIAPIRPEIEPVAVNVTAKDLFDFNVSDTLRETLANQVQNQHFQQRAQSRVNHNQQRQNSRAEARSLSNKSQTQYSNMKPNGIGTSQDAFTRTPIYNNLKSSCNDGNADQRTVSQLSVPLSAIRSVDSSHNSRELLASKQLTSVMLVSDGINTTRNNYRGEEDGLKLDTRARQRLEVNTHRSNAYEDSHDKCIIVSQNGHESPNCRANNIEKDLKRSQICEYNDIRSEPGIDRAETLSQRADTETREISPGIVTSQGGSPGLGRLRLPFKQNPNHNNTQTIEDEPPTNGDDGEANISKQFLTPITDMNYGAPTFGTNNLIDPQGDLQGIMIYRDHKPTSQLKEDGSPLASLENDNVTDQLAIRNSQTLTDRGSMPPSKLATYNPINQAFKMRARVNKMPEVVTGAVDLGQSQICTDRSTSLQKQVQLRRGLQGFSPRTSKNPVIKELDQRKFRTIGTRNFNEQVLTSTASRQKGGKPTSPRRSLDMQNQQTAQPQRVTKKSMTLDGRKLKMAKITGGLRMSHNTKKEASGNAGDMQAAPIFTTKSIDYAQQQYAINQTKSVGQSFASQGSVEGNASIKMFSNEKAIQKAPSLTIDFNKMKVPLSADIDSSRTPKGSYQHGQKIDSKRSQASIVREIEKVTKYTEAEIRASIQISSSRQEQKKPEQSQEPQTINICFMESLARDLNQEIVTQTLGSNTSTPYQTRRVASPHLRLKVSKAHSRKFNKKTPISPLEEKLLSPSFQKYPLSASISKEVTQIKQESNNGTLGALRNQCPEEEVTDQQRHQQWDKLFQKLVTKNRRRADSCLGRTSNGVNPIKAKSINQHYYVRRDGSPINTDFNQTMMTPLNLPRGLKDILSETRNATLSLLNNRTSKSYENGSRKNKPRQGKDDKSVSKIASTLSASNSSLRSVEGMPQSLNQTLNKKLVPPTKKSTLKLNSQVLRQLQIALNQPSSPHAITNNTSGAKMERITRNMGVKTTSDYHEMVLRQNVRSNNMPNAGIQGSKRHSGSDNTSLEGKRQRKLKQQAVTSSPGLASNTPINDWGNAFSKIYKDVANHTQDHSDDQQKSPAESADHNQANISITDQEPPIKEDDTSRGQSTQHQNTARQNSLPNNNAPEYHQTPTQIVEKTQIAQNSFVTIRRAFTSAQKNRNERKSKQEERAFRLRTPNNRDIYSPSSGTLTPNIYAYAAPPFTQVNSILEAKRALALGSTAKNEIDIARYQMQLIQQQQLRKKAESQEPKKTRRKNELNKYADFTKAFPTPLGKQIEIVDGQKQKMLEFESHLLRLKSYHTGNSPIHKLEPTIVQTQDIQQKQSPILSSTAKKWQKIRVFSQNNSITDDLTKSAITAAKGRPKTQGGPRFATVRQ